MGLRAEIAKGQEAVLQRLRDTEERAAAGNSSGGGGEVAVAGLRAELDEIRVAVVRHGHCCVCSRVLRGFAAAFALCVPLPSRLGRPLPLPCVFHRLRG